jgi:hypothetical protein
VLSSVIRLQCSISQQGYFVPTACLLLTGTMKNGLELYRLMNDDKLF